MFAQSRYFTEVYRNELARRVTALGYRLQTTENGFEIEGVSEEVIRRFSKRGQAIKRAEEKLTAKLGQKLSNDGRAALAHSTRERKRRDLGSSELLAQQRAQLSAEELESLRRLVPNENAIRPKPASRADTAKRASRGADELVWLACEHVFERRTVAAEHAILEQALKFGRGEVCWPRTMRHQCSTRKVRSSCRRRGARSRRSRRTSAQDSRKAGISRSMTRS